MLLSPCIAVTMDVPPFRLSGTVYGALLNHRTALEALGSAVNEPPYKEAPRAPVLRSAPGPVARSPRLRRAPRRAAGSPRPAPA